jgi:hypothetical protein
MADYKCPAWQRFLSKQDLNNVFDQAILYRLGFSDDALVYR